MSFDAFNANRLNSFYIVHSTTAYVIQYDHLVHNNAYVRNALSDISLFNVCFGLYLFLLYAKFSTEMHVLICMLEEERTQQSRY